MTATIKPAISPFAQAKTEFDSNPMHFLNEDLASVPASGIPEEFRKLSRFLPVIVLVPKSAVHDKTTQKKPGPNKSVTDLIDTSDVCLPLDAAKAWSRSIQDLQRLLVFWPTDPGRASPRLACRAQEMPSGLGYHQARTESRLGTR
jgi:hypothetical protein